MKRGKLISVLMILLVALCFVSCTSTTDATITEPLVSIYSLVGYHFEFRSVDKTVEFRFLDVASDEEVASLAKALMDVLPGAKSYTVPVGGNITITVKKSLTEDQFNTFVQNASQIIYNGIYR